MANEWNERLDEQILPFAAGLGKPVVFTEQGYQHHNGTSRNPQTESGSVDTAEQIMAFQGLLRALDGRQDDFLAMHIWQWEMTGSQGSTWNINPSASSNQPDNRPLAQWLSGFVSNLQPGDYNDDGIVDAADYVVWRKAQGQAATFFTGADGDGSGLVDDADYDLWRSRFGDPSATRRGSRIGAGTGHDLDDARRTVCRISPPAGAFRTHLAAELVRRACPGAGLYVPTARPQFPAATLRLFPSHCYIGRTVRRAAIGCRSWAHARTHPSTSAIL